MGGQKKKSMKEKDWPKEALDMYEKIDILGKGSFGFVWMAKRKTEAKGDFDDEYVAVKNIAIKDGKGRLYAQREISILQELKHPNIIKFIREFSVPGGRLIAIQLVRGGDLHDIVKLGALGLPLARLVSRQLIGAVSYMHGRAVIHRDIKPGNCILENLQLGPHQQYDWAEDPLIWSSSEEAELAVESGKWRLMLIDFGFARALRGDEIHGQTKRMRNSILHERSGHNPSHREVQYETITEEMEETERDHTENGGDDDSEKYNNNGAAEEGATNRSKNISAAQESGFDDSAELAAAAAAAAQLLRRTSIKVEDLDDTLAHMADMMPDPDESPREQFRRNSTAKKKVRSMSALGTRAYAAPEIKKKLRRKTKEDIDKADAALTECVADYGMTVDAYSVGWTLRVLLTGVPPNITISYFLQKIAEEGDSSELEAGICCCSSDSVEKETTSLRDRVRDTSELPDEATLLIDALTKTEPEQRMTVREAQNHPYIRGKPGESMYTPPSGDYPSMTGDPVVPLLCADELSKLVEDYHTEGDNGNSQEAKS